VTRAGHRRILVVDDDRGIRLLLVTYLRRQGFQLLEACNGREALTEMRAGNADVVLLDLMMPEVSGMDLLRERAADPSLQWIPIIVVPANNRRQVMADVLDMNVRAVLPKPFDLDTLLATVTQCLEDPEIPAPLAA
jgi:CheY-like chemotaxis protein